MKRTNTHIAALAASLGLALGAGCATTGSPAPQYPAPPPPPAPAAPAASSAQGAAQDFTVDNETGLVIDSFFVSPNDDNDWGDDILGKDTLSSGETDHIRFHGYGQNECIFDIKVVDANKDSWTLQDANLCLFDTLTLRMDGGNMVYSTTRNGADVDAAPAQGSAGNGGSSGSGSGGGGSGGDSSGGSSNGQARQDFWVVNHTGQPIQSFYVSPNNDNNWGDDVLGQATLSDGDSGHIHFTGYGSTDCVFDIKVVDASGQAWTLQDANLCTFDTFTLSKDDNGDVVYATSVEHQ